MTVSGVAQVFSPEYITFIVLVFINALGTSGVYPLAFIIGSFQIGYFTIYFCIIRFQVLKWLENVKEK